MGKVFIVLLDRSQGPANECEMCADVRLSTKKIDSEYLIWCGMKPVIFVYAVCVLNEGLELSAMAA